ncbi:MAG: glycosyltransferase family 2 protein [bacterium]|nr:glycosyltransferase family 2 protein [bacterium]
MITPHLSIVIPAYNEETRILAALAEADTFLQSQSFDYEIIVIDDGSVDRTVEVVESAGISNLRVLALDRNCGKGAAVKAGMRAAKGTMLIYCDADGATPIEELIKLEKAIEAGAAIAIGSRALLSADTTVKTVWYRKYMGRVFNGLVNALILPGIADTQCGFKMFRRDAADYVFGRQLADGFSFDVELLFLARKQGFRITEVPVNWTNVPGSKVNLVRDSLRMLRDIFKFRWNYLTGVYK